MQVFISTGAKFQSLIPSFRNVAYLFLNLLLHLPTWTKIFFGILKNVSFGWKKNPRFWTIFFGFQAHTGHFNSSFRYKRGLLSKKQIVSFVVSIEFSPVPRRCIFQFSFLSAPIYKGFTIEPQRRATSDCLLNHLLGQLWLRLSLIYWSKQWP